MHKFLERIKIGIIGQSGVGKTHFLHNFLFGDLSTRKIKPTVAVEFYQKIINVNEQEISLRVWDSSGQEKYRQIVGYHLQECQVIMLMYDLTDTHTFLELEKWIHRLNKQGINLSTKNIIIIGNKIDLVREEYERKQVKYEQVKSMLVNLNLPFEDIYEVSSNDPQGNDLAYIKEIIQQILSQILAKRTEDDLLTRRVQLNSQGIILTQCEDHTSNDLYCGQCNIF